MKNIHNTIFKVESRDYPLRLRARTRLQFDLWANPVGTKKGKEHDVVMGAQLYYLNELCAECDLLKRLPSISHKRDFKKVLLADGGERLDKKLTSIFENDFRYAERLQYTMSLRDKLEWATRAAVDLALENWLLKKSKAHGFQICRNRDNQLKLQSSGYQWHSLAKKTKGRNRSGYSSIDFTGEIEVMDVAKLMDS